LVGLISDTHGLLRPEAVAALAGSDFIIHAGDVGDPEILVELARIAPVTVVRGNIDTGSWANAWPQTAVLEVGDISILVIHDMAELDLDPAAAGYSAVVSGHSHQPRIRTQDGVLLVNPGSAGRRRFKLPISLGRLHVEAGQVTAELIELALVPSR
jgi:putative phosphoesterase